MYIPEFLSRVGRPFEMLTWHGDCQVREVEIGQLVLPSGNVIAFDPTSVLEPVEVPSFTRSVRPGNYPVLLGVAQERKQSREQTLETDEVAYARVRFSQGEVVTGNSP